MDNKTRLFVDMDGTLAVFRPVNKLETLYEKGYFLNLPPHRNVVAGIQSLLQDAEFENIEVYILSAVLSDSKYALQEKNAWLDKHLPEIDMEHRIFPPCGENKRDYIPGGIRDDDFLLDDYTKNLNAWQPPAKGIKLVNAINDTRGSWAHDRIYYDTAPDELAGDILYLMKDKNKTVRKKIDEIKVDKIEIKTENKDSKFRI